MDEKALDLIMELRAAIKSTATAQKLTDISNKSVMIDWDFVDEDIKFEAEGVLGQAEKLISEFQSEKL